MGVGEGKQERKPRMSPGLPSSRSQAMRTSKGDREGTCDRRGRGPGSHVKRVFQEDRMTRVRMPRHSP